MNHGDITETIVLQPIANAPLAPPPVRLGRTRRRHPAMASRIIATGVSGTAFFGSVAGIAANPPTWSPKSATSAASATANDATTTAVPTSIVIEHVARTFYVDQAGNPVAPPTSTSAPVAAAAVPDTVAAARKAVGTAPAGAVAAPPTSVARAAAPSVTTAPAPGGAPATTAAPTAPTPTAPPAPVSTAPPTTAAPAPKPTTPPTTVPVCKTSKPC